MKKKYLKIQNLRDFWKKSTLTGFILLGLNSPIFAAAWDEKNDPKNFGDMDLQFLNLPFNGAIPFTWSDTYWATYQGGISYRWRKDCPFKSEIGRYGYKIGDLPKDLSCLSPSEKFDLYNGDGEWTLTRFERQRTQIMKTVPGSPEYDPKFKIETWEGLCHAWAPALINYQTPKPIILTNKAGIVIPFAASDLKALLSLGVHLVDGELSPELRDNTFFAGGRCGADPKKLKEKLSKGEITKDEYLKQLNSPACGEDINAGAFHVILTNMLGIKKQGFVIDQTRWAEVWNQPVLEYSYVVLPENPYRLRRDATPGAQSQRHIKTKIKMVVEVPQKWGIAFHPESIKDIEYEYFVDLSWNGEVIGGTWISENRPDFVWVTKKVSPFEGIMQLLEPIYTASVEQKEMMIDKFKTLSKKLFRRMYLEKEFQNEILNLHRTLFANKKNFSSYLFFAILDAVEKKTPLDLKKIGLWVRNGANVNARREKDPENFLLLNAIKLKNLELIKILIEAGGAKSEGTLYSAVASGNMEVVNYLLSKGVKANERAKTKWGELPALFSASLANNLELLNLLLDNGASVDINLQDSELETPLVWALRGAGDEPTLGGYKTIALLLKTGANPNIRNENLYSALSIAKGKTGRFGQEIVNLILKYNGKI